MRTAGGQHIVKAKGQAPIKSRQRSSGAASDMTHQRTATRRRGDMHVPGQPAPPKLRARPDATTNPQIKRAYLTMCKCVPVLWGRKATLRLVDSQHRSDSGQEPAELAQ
jgi:hypothetical protein